MKKHSKTTAKRIHRVGPSQKQTDTLLGMMLEGTYEYSCVLGMGFFPTENTVEGPCNVHGGTMKIDAKEDTSGAALYTIDAWRKWKAHAVDTTKYQARPLPKHHRWASTLVQHKSDCFSYDYVSFASAQYGIVIRGVSELKVTQVDLNTNEITEMKGTFTYHHDFINTPDFGLQLMAESAIRHLRMLTGTITVTRN